MSLPFFDIGFVKRQPWYKMAGTCDSKKIGIIVSSTPFGGQTGSPRLGRPQEPSSCPATPHRRQNCGLPSLLRFLEESIT
jgi:hypothetical protein